MSQLRVAKVLNFLPLVNYLPDDRQMENLLAHVMIHPLSIILSVFTLDF